MHTTSVYALFAEKSTLRTKPFGKPLNVIVHESSELNVCLTYVYRFFYNICIYI